MVHTQEWGPPLWRILHAAAEKLGRQTIQIMATDERYAWVAFLRSIEQTMPCAKCRLHFKVWRLKHPYERFINSYDIRADAREWLWSLHEEVNTEKGVTGPKLEDLPALYGTLDVHEDIARLIEVFQRAVHGLQMKPSILQAFRVALNNLRRFVA